MTDKPIVDITPENREYLDRIAAAKAGHVPVGGAPMPKMPRFDQPPAGDRHTGVQRDKILTPEERASLEKAGQLIPGVGSAYAANQPPPPGPPQIVNPPKAERGLSPETVEALKGLSAASQTEAQQEGMPQGENKDTPKLDQDFDFGEFGQRVQSLLTNKQRREAIEKRIVDLITVEDLILYQEVRQQVPIVPGKFIPIFRSAGGHEDLWVKRQMGTETGSDMYITNKYAMMNLCCGLYGLNGKTLLDHRDKDGLVDDAAFNKKFNQILKYPTAILEDLSVNYVWFVRRVERALVVDEIKGF